MNVARPGRATPLRVLRKRELTRSELTRSELTRARSSEAESHALRAQIETPSARRIGNIFAAVSRYSDSGSDFSTMPAPAKM